jgi:hypothetical protein
MHERRIVAAVRRMKAERKTNVEIAMSVGLTEAAVKGLCNKRRIKLPDEEIDSLPMPIGGKLYPIYSAQASRRGMKLSRFMRLLLAKVVEGNLFDAIIDDDK